MSNNTKEPEIFYILNIKNIQLDLSQEHSIRSIFIIIRIFEGQENTIELGRNEIKSHKYRPYRQKKSKQSYLSNTQSLLTSNSH